MHLIHIHYCILLSLSLSLHLNLSPHFLLTNLGQSSGAPLEENLSTTSLFFNWAWCWGVSCSLWTSSRWSFSSLKVSLCHRRRRTLKKLLPSSSRSDSSDDRYSGSITLRSLSLLMPWRASSFTPLIVFFNLAAL